MKKMTMGVFALMAVFAVSCCKSGCETDGCEVAKATSDSISTIYGKNVGSYILSDYMRFGEEHKTEQTKADIMRGVQLMMGAPATDGTLMGMQIGLQMLQELKQLEEQGVSVDKALVLNAFKQAFAGDSVDMATLRQNSEALTSMLTQIQNRKEEAEEQKMNESDESQANVQSGEEFLKAAMAADSEIKVSGSGLGYKIENGGDDTRVSDNSLVTVNYTGKLVDGTVFDSTEGREPATFSPQGVVPGFGEGLKMLGKGGKATLYIPGNLAYGAKGVPQAGIGPNAMLIFDIEIVDVK